MSSGDSFKTKSSYCRPTPDINAIKKKGLVFQCYDVLEDSAHVETRLGLNIDKDGSEVVPCLNVFGLTEAGLSVFVTVHGSFPYFYVEVPLGFRHEHCDALRVQLDDYLRERVSLVQSALPSLFYKIFKCTEAEYRLAHHGQAYISYADLVDKVMNVDDNGYVYNDKMTLKSFKNRIDRAHIYDRRCWSDAKQNRKEGLINAWYEQKLFKKATCTRKYKHDCEENCILRGPLVRNVTLRTDLKHIRRKEESCTQRFCKIELTMPAYVSKLRSLFHFGEHKCHSNCPKSTRNNNNQYGRCICFHEDNEDDDKKRQHKKRSCYTPFHFELTEDDLGDTSAHRWNTFESNMPYVLRTLIDHAKGSAVNVDGASWFRVVPEDLNSETVWVVGDAKLSRQQIELRLHLDKLHIVTDKQYQSCMAPLRTLSYDIECANFDNNDFPIAEKDRVIQIGCVVQDFDTTVVTRKCCFVLGTCSPLSNTDIFAFEESDGGEREMLMAFATFFNDVNPNIVTGYNIIDFDFRYLFDRARELGIPGFNHMSCLRGRGVRIEQNRSTSGSGFSTTQRRKAKLKQNKLKGTHRDNNQPSIGQWVSSSGGGVKRRKLNKGEDPPESVQKELEEETKKNRGRITHNATIPGVIVMDMLPMIKSYLAKKLKSYTLNNVSQEYLGDQKDDMDYHLIPILQHGSPDDRAKLAKYCVKDSLLPVALMSRFNLTVNVIAKARIVGVPPDLMLKRGVSIQTLVQLYRVCMDYDFIVPFTETGGAKPKFKGATVVDPLAGFYTQPIATLDFASLYPSIMIAFNLCYTTIVTWEQILKNHWIENDHYIVTPAGAYVLTEKVQRGLLPILLERLLGERKVMKRAMAASKKAGNKTKATLFDGRQLAIKVSANSVYGFTGTGGGQLPEFAISESVTAYGRDMIETTKNAIQDHYCKTNGYEYDALVIYGDSVTADTPVLLRQRDGTLLYRAISQLPHTVWHDDAGGTEKTYATLSEPLEVWSDHGFTPIKHVMRHRTNKSIYRVLVHTGMVKVTEDHSLLRENGEVVPPAKVHLGDALMTHSLPVLPTSGTAIPLAYVWGLFYGDGGSCGRYNCPSGKKSSWAINNQSLALLNKAKHILEKHTTFIFKILPTMGWSSGVYKLVPTGKGILGFVQVWRERFYDPQSRHKRIPDEIWSANLESRQAFYDGYYAADGDKDIHGYKRFDNKGTHVLLH